MQWQDELIVSLISQLLIPGAFTPNGDNINDLWNIPGMAVYPGGVVTVYNRYGQKIFQAKNYVSNPWN